MQSHKLNAILVGLSLHFSRFEHRIGQELRKGGKLRIIVANKPPCRTHELFQILDSGLSVQLPVTAMMRNEAAVLNDLANLIVQRHFTRRSI